MRKAESYGLLIIVAAALAIPFWIYFDRALAGEPIAWASPRAFWLLGVIPVLIWVYFERREGQYPTFLFSRVAELRRIRAGRVGRLVVLPDVLRVVAMVLFVMALARPQTYDRKLLRVEGIDIMLVFDLSRSMLEKDVVPSRLDAARYAVRKFLRARQSNNDRIGLVVFAHEAMVHGPMTIDYFALDNIVAGLQIGDVPERGSAIGDALGLALANLRRSSAQGKVIILVSDGESNVAKQFHPRDARDLAKRMGVRVFTISLGPGALVDDLSEPKGTRSLLEDIAETTGGKHYRAVDSDGLARDFSRIHKILKKSELSVVARTPNRELFGFFLGPGLLLLLAEFVMRFTRWRRFP